MAHVLRMPALKLGDPVGVLILMEANDFLFHRQHPCAANYFGDLSALGDLSAAA